MQHLDSLLDRLRNKPSRWLITGVAGFIGSNLLENLLKSEQTVFGMDNFSTGYRHNLEQVKSLVTPEQWARFHFFEGDIRNIEDCRKVCHNIDYVLHQAALGSVPLSLADPIQSNEVNVSGFLNMLIVARDAGVKRFVYAASSSVYGDNPGLPKQEEMIGRPLSPYAVTKYVNELYADVFARCYGLECIGLRYFNVFGPRQDPAGAYAAVIPKWIADMLRQQNVYINGDGQTSRDFCFISNTVQANLLAATSVNPDAVNQVYNVAVGERVSLNQLYSMLKRGLGVGDVCNAIYRDSRAGDVKHSQADISKAEKLLGYKPDHDVESGMQLTLKWYLERVADFG